MQQFDQLNNKIVLNNLPQRIISLVPSQTELLFDLGLGDRVVGRTKFCIHPEGKVKDVAVVGGTKRFRFDQIDRLKPDLIVGNKEENYKEGIENLRVKYPVWMSDIYGLPDAYQMIEQLGGITGKPKEASAMVGEISAAFAALKAARPGVGGKVLYLIWREPYMAVGRQTFINYILEWLGFENVVSSDRYPELSEKALAKSGAERVLLSSEPFPFRGAHVSEIAAILPKAKVEVVDGEMFSWYGSRLLKAGRYFNSWLEKGHLFV